MIEQSNWVWWRFVGWIRFVYFYVCKIELFIHSVKEKIQCHRTATIWTIAERIWTIRCHRASHCNFEIDESRERKAHELPVLHESNDGGRERGDTQR